MKYLNIYESSLSLSVKTSIELNELIGKVIKKIENEDNQQLIFTLTDDTKYALYHWQDCCEQVKIEEIVGDLNDLVNSPITMADCSTNQDNPPENAESFTWTFYKFATVKGYVDIRWLGESNGYYSEKVDFVKLLQAVKRGSGG